MIRSSPLITSDTSAMPRGFRISVPLKITSSIFSLRKAFVLCSPSTQRIASTTLLFPLPFGPTMAVTPSGNSIRASANDLNPTISSDFRYIADSFGSLIGWDKTKRRYGLVL